MTISDRVRFVRKFFGNTSLARDGVNVAVRCPACGNGDKKKFSINLETWQCHCWVCDLRGKTLSHILKKYLDQSACLEFNERFGSPDSNNRVYSNHEDDNPVILPNGFIPLIDLFNDRDPDIRDCFKYAHSRGITEKDLWRFRIGASRSGKFRRRLIIPSFDIDGNLNYFCSRSIDPDSFRKYLNSKAKKTDIIFNEIDIDWNKELAIVEGPLDLIKASQNATCLLGSALSDSSYLFKRIVSNKTPVLLALDADVKKKSHKIAKLLSSYCCEVRMLELGSYQDVGEMSRKQFYSMSSKSKKWDDVEYLKMSIDSIQTGSII